jgi:hypothetical protein
MTLSMSVSLLVATCPYRVLHIDPLSEVLHGGLGSDANVLWSVGDVLTGDLDAGVPEHAHAQHLLHPLPQDSRSVHRLPYIRAYL